MSQLMKGHFGRPFIHERRRRKKAFGIFAQPIKRDKGEFTSLPRLAEDLTLARADGRYPKLMAALGAVLTLVLPTFSTLAGFVMLAAFATFGMLTALALASLATLGVLEFRVTGLAGISNVCLWLP